MSNKNDNYCQYHESLGSHLWVSMDRESESENLTGRSPYAKHIAYNTPYKARYLLRIGLALPGEFNHAGF